MARMPKASPPAVALLALLGTGCAQPCAPRTNGAPAKPAAYSGPAGGIPPTKPQEATEASTSQRPTLAARETSKRLLGLPIGSGAEPCEGGLCKAPPAPLYLEGDTYPSVPVPAAQEPPAPPVAAHSPPPSNPACWQFAAAIGTGVLALAGFFALFLRKPKEVA